MELRERRATVVDHDTEARTVTVRLCRWDEIRDVTDADGRQFREVFPRGSLEPMPDIHAVTEHNGTLIGRADVDTFADDGTGPTIEVRMARTAAGTDTLELIDAGVIRSVSMEFDPIENRPGPDGLLVRARAALHGIAFAFRPAHDAPILATRENQPNGAPEMTVIDTPHVPDPDPDPAPGLTYAPRSTHVDAVTSETLNRELDEIRREIIAVAPPSAPAVLGAEFRSFGDYAVAVYRGDADPTLLHRALVDQITTDNPGVMGNGHWITEIAGIVTAGRPTINAFGAESAGSSGMSVNWPFFDGTLLDLVAEQAAEKTEINSVKVSIKNAAADLATYAGGSDVSWQLRDRSSPDYMNAYSRIMLAAFNARTNYEAAQAAYAASTLGPGAWDGVDADGLRSAFFASSVAIQAATGSPATFALASTSAFVAIGGTDGLWPKQNGTSNTMGTADAGTLSVNVSGIDVIHDPQLGDGVLLMSNGSTASWFEDGPKVATADDVAKLGTNVAVWGLGTFGASMPAGIVQVGFDPPVQAGSTSSKSSK